MIILYCLLDFSKPFPVSAGQVVSRELTFRAGSMLFLTDQFSGQQCDPVTLVLGKLDPGDSLAWHSLGFEVKEA